MNQQSDASLVACACGGETAAFGELVSRYENAARVVALRHVRDHHSAEDVAQAAFVRAFEQLGSLRDGSKFSAWLLRIVQREAMRVAGQRRHASLELTVANEPESQPESAPLDDDLQEAVEILSLLPEHERAVMLLHHLDGHSTAEIASITSRPLGTVTKQLSRATKRVQALAARRERRIQTRG